MPTYVYECKCGEVYSKFVTEANTEKKVGCPKCKKGNKADWQRTFSKNNVPSAAIWNRPSFSMAIAAGDVERQKAVLAKHGVVTEYVKDPTGSNSACPVMRSAAHNKAHSEALGFTNLTGGGWSDPVSKLKGREGADEYGGQDYGE